MGASKRSLMELAEDFKEATEAFQEVTSDYLFTVAGLRPLMLNSTDLIRGKKSATTPEMQSPT